MPWKETSLPQLARELGVDYEQTRQKHKLIALIVGERKRQALSQAMLAQRVGVTQGRIAQIESGIGTRRMTFDVLLRVLTALGYEVRFSARRRAA